MFFMYLFIIILRAFTLRLTYTMIHVMENHEYIGEGEGDVQYIKGISQARQRDTMSTLGYHEHI